MGRRDESLTQCFANPLGRGSVARHEVFELLGCHAERLRPVTYFIGIVNVDAFVVG